MGVLIQMSSLFLALWVERAFGASLEEPHLYSRTIQGNAKLIIPNVVNGSDSHYFLVICKTEKLPTETNCTLTSQNMLNQLNNTCEFGVKHHGDQSFIFESFPLEVTVFSGANEALIQWKERNSHFDDGIIYKYAAILTISTCKMEPLSYTHYNQSQEASETFVDSIIYASMFDLIISDPNRCDGLSTCKISFNAKGTQIDGPASFPIKNGILEVIPASPTSISNGLYVLANEIVGQPELNFKYISGSGHGTMEIITRIKFNTKGLSIVHSNANGMFTICGITSKKVHCEQYEIEAIFSSLDVVSYRAKNVIAVYTLSKGGFLLVTVDCESTVELTCNRLNVIEIHKYKPENDIGGMIMNLNCGKDLSLIKTVVSNIQPNVFCFRVSCLSESYKQEERFSSTFQVFEGCIERKSSQNKTLT
ncbi:hypothetical protein QAD02_016126 [Eretmocerus hayati]|uniref:Uncharacterized protein n=1 Tax=Eretmocerus hayati TaxID=131215 RepID=A0ACC2PAL2_9HYME|nr:hypothetical protein QAD02_016126 [Eretmocerus hayati]